MSNQNPAKSNVSLHSNEQHEEQFDISESSYKTTHTAVRKARRFTLQGLYEWLMTDRRFEQTGHGEWRENPPHDIAARTRATNAMHTVHLGYYHTMMREIPEQIEALEDLIKKHLDRDIDKIDMVEHAVLLIGAYELKNSLHIPYKVVLDEAMKLNTHFGATDAHKLINAVMDKMAAELRAVEVEADTDSGYKEIKNASKNAKKNAQDIKDKKDIIVKKDIKDNTDPNATNIESSTTETNTSNTAEIESPNNTNQSESANSQGKSRIGLKPKK